MNTSPLSQPSLDPTPIFEHFRGSYGTELLTAAVAHFDAFGILSTEPATLEQLQTRLGLERRPAVVLITALRAMGLIGTDGDGRLIPTPLADEHLRPGAPFEVSDYIGLAAGSPGVLEMVKRLRSNRPAGLDEDGDGAAFIYRKGVPSAMEQDELARHLTLTLAGRAKNVAPVLADRVPLDGAATLLDVGGGTGIYSVALLRRHPEMNATVLDRPEVLKTADEFAAEFGVTERLTTLQADMFSDPLPKADIVLLSNILHDWDEPECRTLVARCANALNPGGRLLIHDVLLNDELDGPLPIALYSAALFTLTEGRAYSAAEYRGWMADAGLAPEPTFETLVHCSVVPGRRA